MSFQTVELEKKRERAKETNLYSEGKRINKVLYFYI